MCAAPPAIQAYCHDRCRLHRTTLATHHHPNFQHCKSSFLLRLQYRRTTPPGITRTNFHTPWILPPPCNSHTQDPLCSRYNINRIATMRDQGPMPQAPADIEGLASCTCLGRGAGYAEEAACWVTQELGVRMLGHGRLLGETFHLKEIAA